MDHIPALSDDREHQVRNWQLLCSYCNRATGNQGQGGFRTKMHELRERNVWTRVMLDERLAMITGRRLAESHREAETAAQPFAPVVPSLPSQSTVGGLGLRHRKHTSSKQPGGIAELGSEQGRHWRHCRSQELVGQLPPFSRNPHTPYGATELRTSLAVILILTSLLLACTSEPAPPPQLGNCRAD